MPTKSALARTRRTLLDRIQAANPDSPTPTQLHATDPDFVLPVIRGEAQTAVWRARDFYTLAVKFPHLAKSLQHPALNMWRRKLFEVKARYAYFFDLDKHIHNNLPSVAFSLDNEEHVRTQLVAALSILHLARSVDMARLKREFTVLDDHRIKLSWQRKLRNRYHDFVAHSSLDMRWNIPVT